MNRRDSLKALTVGVAALATGNRSAFAKAVAAPHKMTVYKDPDCGCCKAWVKHVRDAGFDVNAIDVDDVQPYKTKYGVTSDLASCHTALVEGYVVEGHVPADLIERFLKAPPKDARGLAVPGMPMGSPGMEMGSHKDPYDVMVFYKSGKKAVFAHR